MVKRKNTTLLIGLLFIFFYCQSYAQKKFDEFNVNQKNLIFLDDFNISNNNWLIEKAKLENGSLIINDKLGFKPKASININLDTNKDFEIEIVSSTVKEWYPIIFLNNLRWMFSGNDSKIYYKKENAKNYPKTYSSNESVKCTIRKIGSSYFFFINEFYIGLKETHISELNNGINLGFAGIASVDKVHVGYLEKHGYDQDKPSLSNRNNNSSDGIDIKSNKDGGKYFALIIGVANYDDPKMKLEHPTNDAFKLKEVLLNRYTFTDSTTFLVLNPTRQKLMSELFRLRKIIGPNDNLLIFYAGHGHWDEDARQGYWWPKDATTEDPSNWLSNSDLREQIRSIKSAHTLLISDACFSGGIFKTRSGAEIMNASKDIQLLYKMPSRRAMTSGTLTTVPDKSVFLEYLCKRLNENQAKFMSSQYLFDSFRAAVINNSNVVPQDGVIAETGDEGGDFIFILKNK